MLYSGFNNLPRSVFWSANLNGRSDNTDVIQLLGDRIIWLVLTFWLCLWLLSRWAETDVLETNPESSWADWPPISDDEFMSRCETGTPREVALKVRRVISESLGVPYEYVYPEHRLIEDLGAE